MMKKFNKNEKIETVEINDFKNDKLLKKIET